MQLYFASTYGSGAYDATTYNGSSTVPVAATTSNTASGSTGKTANSSTGGSLTNTGFDLVLIASLACIIMFIALIVKFWHTKPANA
jgi:hypothetical protein